jgi:hypothetical protein
MSYTNIIGKTNDEIFKSTIEAIFKKRQSVIISYVRGKKKSKVRIRVILFKFQLSHIDDDHFLEIYV